MSSHWIAGQQGASPTPGAGQIPVVRSILKDFSAEALGELRTWLEQNPPSIPITQIVGFKNTQVIAGICSQAGGVFQGTGFVSVRNSVGNYTVTFDKTQGTQVVVTATPYSTGGLSVLIPQIVVATASAFTVNFATTAGVATDTHWTFLAAPPT